MTHASSFDESLGRLVYEESIIAPEQWNSLSTNRAVIIIATFLALAVIPLMTVLFLMRTISLNWTVDYTTLAITMSAIGTSFLVYRFFRDLLYSATPIRLYENGLVLPASIFERVLHGPKALGVENIRMIYPVLTSFEESHEYSGLVVVTDDKKSHRTSIKNPNEISAIVGMIDSQWVGLFRKYGEFEFLTLEQRRRLARFSNRLLWRIGNAFFVLFFVFLPLSFGLYFLSTHMSYVLLVATLGILFLLLGLITLYIYAVSESFRRRLELYQESRETPASFERH